MKRPTTTRAVPAPPPVVRALPPRTLAQLCTSKAFCDAYARLRDAEAAARYCGYTLLAEEAR